MERPRWLPVPRQKLIEPGRRMAINHSFEHISEIGEGLEVIELGRGNERSDNGPAIAAAVRAGEQMVLAAEATGRMARSTELLSSSMRPSSRKRESATHRVSA